MKNVKDAWCINIELTNKCERACSNCHHLVKYTKPWEMDMDTFHKALDSLRNWDRYIGVIGGNPVLHTQFKEISEAMKKVCGAIFLSNWGGRKSYIEDHYRYINYNPHEELCMHQPVLVSSQDMIPDKATRDRYISDCWIAQEWSPSITPKGCYRCEVMGCMDMALNWNMGLPVVEDWWKLPLKDFQKQIDAFCNICGICIPYEERRDRDEIDDMTISAVKLFKAHRKVNMVSGLGYDPEKYRKEHPEKYLVRMRP